MPERHQNDFSRFEGDVFAHLAHWFRDSRSFQIFFWPEMLLSVYKMKPYRTRIQSLETQNQAYFAELLGIPLFEKIEFTKIWLVLRPIFTEGIPDSLFSEAWHHIPFEQRSPLYEQISKVRSLNGLMLVLKDVDVAVFVKTIILPLLLTKPIQQLIVKGELPFIPVAVLEEHLDNFQSLSSKHFLFEQRTFKRTEQMVLNFQRRYEALHTQNSLISKKNFFIVRMGRQHLRDFEGCAKYIDWLQEQGWRRVDSGKEISVHLNKKYKQSLRLSYNFAQNKDKKNTHSKLTRPGF